MTATLQDNRNHAVQIGMILVGTWGWEQTNVDFFKVVDLVGKATLVLQRMGWAISGDDCPSSMSAMVVPKPLDTEDTCRVRVSPKQTMKNPDGYNSYLKVWNGDPVYCSWYA